TFQTRVWPRREELRPAAELVAWRARENLGRPSWWRGGADTSFTLRTEQDLKQMRRRAAAALAAHPGRPVGGVFNHAISDALGANRESFRDLAAWFEETVWFAQGTPQVNWIFLDHPQQYRYDSTGHFEELAARTAGAPGIRFLASKELPKNKQ